MRNGVSLSIVFDIPKVALPFGYITDGERNRQSANNSE
jgi:hypothetical protein